ncbi:hypothetical protein [Nocardioides xinjiangensis]|uniref:hypothetical protein n=1 Tax=Nocardioides xinjiangensis TaxID=2817376 RepID=UPI001B300424|nr:hypothetical protein [Nocardioides sp. SYSU D00514]
MQHDTSKGTPVAINASRPLNGHIVDVGSRDDGSPHEVITYWECSGGHIVIHTGHTDATTMTSVEDGSVTTSIPCGSSDSPSSGSGWSIEVQGSGFLATVPPDLVDRVDVGDSTFVVATQGGAADSDRSLTIWSTATCEGGHVVMHYGHEDAGAGTSVYDGSVVTSVPC